MSFRNRMFTIGIGIADYGSYNGYIDFFLSRYTSTNLMLMLVYARKAGPLVYCEPAISRNGYASFNYARDVLRGRFKMCESNIKSLYSNPWWKRYIEYLEEIGLGSVARELEERCHVE